LGAVRFYHLSETGLEGAAPPLLEKALERRMRAVVRVGPRAALEAVDAMLWTYDAAAFLPHGRDDEPHAALQPILLTRGRAAPNAPDVLMLVGGAEAETEEFSAYERVWLIFDGADAEAVEAARADWRRVAGAGLAAEYWAQAGGRWVRKAASGAEA
jgi:DNA polymerase-3 subunit chi